MGLAEGSIDGINALLTEQPFSEPPPLPSLCLKSAPPPDTGSSYPNSNGVAMIAAIYAGAPLSDQPRLREYLLRDAAADDPAIESEQLFDI